MGDEHSVRDDAREVCPMAASKGLTGGSLPPRKRLLVGLKQNGWSISSAVSPCPSRSPADAAVGAATAAGKDDGSVIVQAGSEVGKPPEEGCARCGGCENSAWRRLKKGGVSQRFCNSCVLLYSTNLYCPHCLGLYQDVSSLGDPSVWLVCCKCQRSVHVECESENNNNTASDPLSYLCPNCITHKSPCNGVFGSRENSLTESKGAAADSAKSKKGRSGESPSENPKSGSHLCKKPRVGREIRTNHNIGVLSVHREGLGLGQVSSTSRSKVSGASSPCKSIVPFAAVSAQEAAVAAKAAAASMAAKAAAAAKATAVAKACVAAKAAAAARAALEAAALAARAEARAREELCARSIFVETQGQASVTKMQIAVGTEQIVESVDKVENSLDDEELARQLHRVMNSSPRITRSATPINKKLETKTEIDAELKVSAHGSSCSSDEPPPFPKPQLTRPRSVIHKENKRWELKVSSSEVAKSEGENIKSGVQQSTSQTAVANDESSSGHRHRLSPSASIEHSDGNTIVTDKQNTVALLNTSTSGKLGALDPANPKMENLGGTPLPAVCDESKKIGHSSNSLIEVAPYEAAKVPVGGSKLKKGNRSGLHSQILEEQSSLRDDRSKGQGASQQKPGKATDKQKIHHWKSVSTLLSSGDNKRMISDKKPFSLSQRSEDNEGRSNRSIQNGMKNGENFGIRSKFKPFSRGGLGNQPPGIKGNVSRLEAEQTLTRHKVSKAEKEAVSTVGSSCKVVRNSNDDPTSLHVDVLKGNKLASGPNAMPFTAAPSSATMAALTCSSIARHS
ncbi:hypothetical protein O6H91_09G065100 [Diphasiastrum complanatum]|uniref:Uncharacterized protein n=2 Tax=Diphasiastrum complanatum TaxID=34168 RepID=A0ACC2CQ40_DIPCM|nr:hypothetical protein O6H91_09G065100 [Diphasiastrum complanatum]KAJ7544119.1 hypothetical protein O6H91_09G065100 [Diphasiastrum complanatum]